MIPATLFAAFSSIFGLAASLPTASSEIDAASSAQRFKRNDACSFHYILTDDDYVNITAWLPSTVNGDRKIDSQVGYTWDGMSMCSDKLKRCLTVNKNTEESDDHTLRFGFGADIWLNSDKPRCTRGGWDVKKTSGFLGILAEEQYKVREGDCSFACSKRFNF